jgi:hypothetical protein
LDGQLSGIKKPKGQLQSSVVSSVKCEGRFQVTDTEVC